MFFYQYLVPGHKYLAPGPKYLAKKHHIWTSDAKKCCFLGAKQSISNTAPDHCCAASCLPQPILGQFNLTEIVSRPEKLVSPICLIFLIPLSLGESRRNIMVPKIRYFVAGILPFKEGVSLVVGKSGRVPGTSETPRGRTACTLVLTIENFNMHLGAENYAI